MEIKRVQQTMNTTQVKRKYLGSSCKIRLGGLFALCDGMQTNNATVSRLAK